MADHGGMAEGKHIKPGKDLILGVTRSPQVWPKMLFLNLPVSLTTFECHEMSVMMPA